jgi:hypothetical protein
MVYFESCVQCCGSVTFWLRIRMRGSVRLKMDPDSALDPAIFLIDLQNAAKKPIFFYVILLITF